MSAAISISGIWLIGRFVVAQDRAEAEACAVVRAGAWAMLGARVGMHAQRHQQHGYHGHDHHGVVHALDKDAEDGPHVPGDAGGGHGLPTGVIRVWRG
ncbi:MAG TPA: hypothetical protein DCS97_05305 [Planctomycetes bacterium]|nr:hypothetical protein [Planctomycetota bacterium]